MHAYRLQRLSLFKIDRADALSPELSKTAVRPATHEPVRSTGCEVSRAHCICSQVARFAPLRRQMLMLLSQRTSCDVRVYAPSCGRGHLVALGATVHHLATGSAAWKGQRPSGATYPSGHHWPDRSIRQPGAMRRMPVPLCRCSTLSTVARWRDSNASTAESERVQRARCARPKPRRTRGPCMHFGTARRH